MRRTIASVSSDPNAGALHLDVGPAPTKPKAKRLRRLADLTTQSRLSWRSLHWYAGTASLWADAMQRYYELVELARVYWRNSQTAYKEESARKLRRLAGEYLQEAAKLDGGNVPDIDLVCLNEARQRHADRRKRTPAAGFVHRCPNTGLRVQGWVVDKRDDESYEAVTCLVCGRVHLVNPKTSEVLAEDHGE